MNRAEFRFYEELNDFLLFEKRNSSTLLCFNGSPLIKDAIESIGVPHTEVDLVFVKHKSVRFSYHLRDRDTVMLYPVIDGIDTSKVTYLRKKHSREPKFIMDVHLGKLARYLQMLGFDTLYKNNYSDSEILKISKTERRTILKRDIGILKIK